MDLISGFKSELFRPLVTLLIPGAAFLAPYVLVARNYAPSTFESLLEHSGAFVAVLLTAITAVGLILEDVGALLESKAWDPRLQLKDPNHLPTWEKYLALRSSDEVIGQRYLRTVLVRMKFELSMAPALMIHAVGLIWLNRLTAMWSTKALVCVVGLIVLTGAYLLWESWSSANVLAKTRRIIVAAASQQQGLGPSQQPADSLLK